MYYAIYMFYKYIDIFMCYLYISLLIYIRSIQHTYVHNLNDIIREQKLILYVFRNLRLKPEEDVEKLNIIIDCKNISLYFSLSSRYYEN